MATVVIFWSVLMAAIFFTLSIVFNAIGAIIEALEETIKYILWIVVLAVLLFLALYLIIGIADNRGNEGKFMGSILLMVFDIVIVAVIGRWLLKIVSSVLLMVITWFCNGSEVIAHVCESCFNHFVRVIKNRIDIS